MSSDRTSMIVRSERAWLSNSSVSGEKQAAKRLIEAFDASVKKPVQPGAGLLNRPFRQKSSEHLQFAREFQLLRLIERFSGNGRDPEYVHNFGRTGPLRKRKNVTSTVSRAKADISPQNMENSPKKTKPTMTIFELSVRLRRDPQPEIGASRRARRPYADV